MRLSQFWANHAWCQTANAVGCARPIGRRRAGVERACVAARTRRRLRSDRATAPRDRSRRPRHPLSSHVRVDSAQESGAARSLDPTTHTMGLSKALRLAARGEHVLRRAHVAPALTTAQAKPSPMSAIFGGAAGPAMPPMDQPVPGLAILDPPVAPATAPCTIVTTLSNGAKIASEDTAALRSPSGCRRRGLQEREPVHHRRRAPARAHGVQGDPQPHRVSRHARGGGDRGQSAGRGASRADGVHGGLPEDQPARGGRAARGHRHEPQAGGPRGGGRRERAQGGDDRPRRQPRQSDDGSRTRRRLRRRPRTTPGRLPPRAQPHGRRHARALPAAELHRAAGRARRLWLRARRARRRRGAAPRAVRRRRGGGGGDGASAPRRRRPSPVVGLGPVTNVVLAFEFAGG